LASSPYRLIRCHPARAVADLVDWPASYKDDWRGKTLSKAKGGVDPVNVTFQADPPP
jgi:hypothetical protein